MIESVVTTDRAEGLKMARSATKAKRKKTVETLIHEESKRKNIPTAEYQAVVQKEQERPLEARYQRNRDLDPQLVWRGKDEQDWSDLVVNVPPLYIQEKVHPKALIDDLLRTSASASTRPASSRPICSPTSTAFHSAWTRRSSTSTTRTGRTV